MGFDFREWFSCPACDGREDVSTLTHRTVIILECHDCGQVSEYAIGDDVPIHGLDLDAIADVADEGTSD